MPGTETLARRKVWPALPGMHVFAALLEDLVGAIDGGSLGSAVFTWYVWGRPRLVALSVGDQ